MRSFRQILRGCKKHKFRFFRRVRWYEEEYQAGMRSKWICVNCYEIAHMEMKVHGTYLPD